MTPYDKLIARKRTWTPVQTEAGKLKEGAEEAVFRALALRCLELPVGDFISHSLKGEIPAAAREILEMNITDEENHDRALNFAVRALGTDPRAEREAEVLKKLGKSIQTTPYSRQWWLREASSFASSRSFGTPVTLD